MAQIIISEFEAIFFTLDKVFRPFRKYDINNIYIIIRYITVILSFLYRYRYYLLLSKNIFFNVLCNDTLFFVDYYLTGYYMNIII